MTRSEANRIKGKQWFLSQRNLEIIQMRKDKVPVFKIADHFALTRTRIHQIFVTARKYGLL